MKEFEPQPPTRDGASAAAEHTHRAGLTPAWLCHAAAGELGAAGSTPGGASARPAARPSRPASRPARVAPPGATPSSAARPAAHCRPPRPRRRRRRRPAQRDAGRPT
eukprot:scaffold10277_cov90-Isochrysis_galbana.AAC.3